MTKKIIIGSGTKTRPSDPKIEFALLTWWKCCLCEMLGNDCFKHYRDYKAIVTLFCKWMELIKDSKIDWDIVNYDESKEYLDYSAKDLQDEYMKTEDIRIAVHSYLKDLNDGIYNPKGIEFPEQWGMIRIRELTQS